MADTMPTNEIFPVSFEGETIQMRVEFVATYTPGGLPLEDSVKVEFQPGTPFTNDSFAPAAARAGRLGAGRTVRREPLLPRPACGGRSRVGVGWGEGAFALDRNRPMQAGT